MFPLFVLYWPDGGATIKSQKTCMWTSRHCFSNVEIRTWKDAHIDSTSPSLVWPDNNIIFLADIMFTSTLCVPPEAPVYQAASPDEEALVGTARELGWVFLSRTRDFIVVSELGVTREYQLLALLDFTSHRRRMSVLGESSTRNTHFNLTIFYNLQVELLKWYILFLFVFSQCGSLRVG